jgi:thiol-disulfide isomerase/thioredoxin
MKSILFFLFFCILMFVQENLYPENIGGHFELSVMRKDNPDAVYITISPKGDKQIKGISDEEPFITLTSPDVVFENDGVVVQTDYITTPSRRIFQFPFYPVRQDRDLTRIEVHLTITFVPCRISTGVCLFPETVEREYQLQVSKGIINTGMINTIILATFFVLAAIGLIIYIKEKKNIIFTAFFVLLFSGMLFYAFTQPDAGGTTQADVSRDIASTLCLSCIGIESSGGGGIPVNREKTGIYATLDEPVLITIFSASWCGTCPLAKEYIKELCSLYPGILSYEVIEISEPRGKEQYNYYKSLYEFKEPIPLPALIVSVNKTGVLYGTRGLEEHLIQLIIEGMDEKNR